MVSLQQGSLSPSQRPHLSSGRVGLTAILTLHGSPLRLVVGKLASSVSVIWVETEKKAHLAAHLAATRCRIFHYLALGTVVLRGRGGLEAAGDGTEGR